MVKKIVRKSFLRNKLRNGVILIALIIVSAMLTALCALAFSVYGQLNFNLKRRVGSESHISFESLTSNEIMTAEQHRLVKEGGKCALLGQLDAMESSGREFRMGAADEKYAQYHFSKPEVGRMPAQENEIAMDTITLKLLGIEPILGEKIQLNWHSVEEQREVSTHEFILVGFWEGNDAHQVSWLWVADGLALYAKEFMADFIFISNFNIDALARVLADDLDNQLYQIHEVYSIFQIIRFMLPEFVLFLAGLLLVFISGCLIINNVLQISVVNDILFYGRLKVMGTSPRQIKRILYAQMHILCLGGIPLGIIGGLLAGRILVPMIILGGGDRMDYFHAAAIIMSGILTYLMTIAACWGPAQKASKIMPADAMKQVDGFHDHSYKNRKAGSMPILFQMSLSNLGRNKRRTLSTVFLLAIGMVLLNCLITIEASFDSTKYLEALAISDFSVVDQSPMIFSGNKNVRDSKITQEMINQIKEVDGFVELGRLFYQEEIISLNDKAYSNILQYFGQGERLSYMAGNIRWMDGYKKMVAEKSCVAMIYGADDFVVNALSDEYNVINGRFDAQKFLSGNYAIAQGYLSDSGNMDEQPTFDVGDNVIINGQSFEIMMIVGNIQPITEGNRSIRSTFSLSFYLPAGQFLELYPENTIRKLFFNMDESDSQAVGEILEGYANISVTGKESLLREYKNQTRSVTVMGMVVSYIILFIGILNLSNSLVTAIIERRKELAMIRSIGLTKNQLSTLLVFEGLNYSVITLLITYITSILATGIWVKSYIELQWASTYQFTIMPLLICTPFIIIISLLVPMLSYHYFIDKKRVEKF